MKIVADENIPLIENYFGQQGELILKPGREISRSDVIDADILLVRSVTKVNQALLENTSVTFVGSATSGADHLDTDWLDSNKIKWSVAESCNAMAVAEYVVCVIAALQKMQCLTQQKIRAAVVGVGRIGRLVAEKFRLLGFDVILCDPLRTDIDSTPFEELSDFDLISFHVPLTKTGCYPTYHLVKKEFLQKQKKDCVLLNAARGEVFSFDQLKKYGRGLIWCLDVWEGEPNIDVEILERTLIATPHIAGYSLQSKYRGIEMIYNAALQKGVLTTHSVGEILYPTKKITIDVAEDWRDVVLTIFDPVSVTAEMKKRFRQEIFGFDDLRKKYAERYEFKFIELLDSAQFTSDNLLLGLGFDF